MTSIAFKNRGRIASDIIEDRAFVYADGYFETMRVVNGKIPLLNFHLERALNTAATLKINLTQSDISDHIHHCLSSSDDTLSGSCIYKLIVSRGSGGRASYPLLEGSPALYSFLREYRLPEREHVSLKTVSDPLPSSSSFPGLKLLHRLDYIVATQGIQFADYEEALFLNTDACLVETMHHNIFFSDGASLCTPSLSHYGVAGVMRNVLMNHIAPKLGVTVVEGNYSLSDLERSHGVFLTNAIEGVVSVNKLDDMLIPSHPVVKQLRQALSAFLTL